MTREATPPDHGSENAPPAPPTAEEVAAALSSMFSAHQDCTWMQVGGCVYCADHVGVRLYQGELPESRRTTPKCVEHDWDDGDSMCQSGFYLLCLTCGEKEWTE